MAMIASDQASQGQMRLLRDSGTAAKVGVMAAPQGLITPCGALRQHRAGCCRNGRDRKSTRLNSSHTVISYAVFCLKKKKRTMRILSASLEEKNMTSKSE